MLHQLLDRDAKKCTQPIDNIRRDVTVALVQHFGERCSVDLRAFCKLHNREGGAVFELVIVHASAQVIPDHIVLYSCEGLIIHNIAEQENEQSTLE